MNEQSLAQALSPSLDPAEEPAGGRDSRAEFEARFAAELLRLEKSRREPDAAQAESLLSALGAAGVREWELALAFLGAAKAPIRARRAALSLGVLRRRFQLVMSAAR
jgi:hypothetical protein